MTTRTRTELEALIDELHRSAARNIALKNDVEARYPWRRHDARIYSERAQADLAAVRHLMEEL
jgi:hypothetical protein